MIRRSPTRIELKLEDLVEFNQIRQEYDAQKSQRLAEQKGWMPPPPPKTKQEAQQNVHERIGFNPQPRPSF